MENLYKISKGQLVTLWVFGTIGWFFTFDPMDYGESWAVVLFVLIPFAVIFYTIGWRERHREEWNSIKSWRPKKSTVKKVVGAILVAFVASAVISTLSFFV